MLIVTELNETLTIKDKDNSETYKVKPVIDDGNGCTICVFNGKEICSHMACCIIDRPDSESVYFEKIK